MHLCVIALGNACTEHIGASQSLYLDNYVQDLPQLRRAPIVKVLYIQANIGFAAEAVFFWGGGRGRFAQRKGVTLLPRATDFWEKKFSASPIRIVSYCKYYMHFNKYDMYSIVGIDKKTYGEGIGITYIYT